MQETKNKYVSRGRRYSPGEKIQILADAKELGVAQAADKHGASKWTIYDWLRQEKRAKKKAEAQTADNGRDPESAELAASDTTSSTEQDERTRLILELWRQQPGLGPSQIRNQLKRRGFKASVNTVRNIMEDHGYVQPKVRRKEHSGAYEAIRPLQLVHLDFVHFFIHSIKQCLLLMIDDFSRFIVGWALLRSEHADGVISAFDESVGRYGKPEGVMTDRGAGFHSWRGISRFERVLEEMGVDHYLATEPQTNGKAEALAATVQKELTRQVEFADLTDAARHIERWVLFYNYKRTHHALGGVLVPADRFHGWQEETLKRIEQGNGADMLDLLSPESRGLELFKVVSIGGEPTVYLMGRRILG
jgi:transposase InsO family protein